MESYNAALALGYEPLLDLWEEWRHESPVLDLETGEVVPARRRHHGAPPQLWRVSSPPKDFQKETLEFFPRISRPPPPPEHGRRASNGASPRASDPSRKERTASGNRPIIRKHWRQLLGAVVKQLQDIPQGWSFLKPVHKYTDIPIENRKAYYKTIQRPVDLDSIAHNLDRYPSPKDFVEDLELMFDNCFAFNKPGDDVYIAGSQLRKIYRESYDLMREQIEASYAAELDEGTASKPGEWKLPRFDPEPPKFEVTKGWWANAEEGTLRKRPREQDEQVNDEVEAASPADDDGEALRKRARVQDGQDSPQESKRVDEPSPSAKVSPSSSESGTVKGSEGRRKKGKKGKKTGEKHKHKGKDREKKGGSKTKGKTDSDNEGRVGKEGADTVDEAREKVVARLLMKEERKISSSEEKRGLVVDRLVEAGRNQQAQQDGKDKRAVGRGKAVADDEKGKAGEGLADMTKKEKLVEEKKSEGVPVVGKAKRVGKKGTVRRKDEARRGKTRAKGKKGTKKAAASPTASEGAVEASPASPSSPSSSSVGEEREAEANQPEPAALSGEQKVSSPLGSSTSPSPSASSSGDDLAPISSLVFDKNSEAEKKMQSIASSFHAAMVKSEKPPHGKKRKKREAASSRPNRSASPSPSSSEASPAASSLRSPSPSEDEKQSSKGDKKAKKKHRHHHHHHHHKRSTKKRRLESGDSPSPSELCSSSPSELASLPSPSSSENLSSPPSPSTETIVTKTGSSAEEKPSAAETQPTPPAPPPPALTLPIPSKRAQSKKALLKTQQPVLSVVQLPAITRSADISVSSPSRADACGNMDAKGTGAESPKLVAVESGESPEEDLFGEPIKATATDEDAATVVTPPEAAGAAVKAEMGGATAGAKDE
ncbi:transcription initiation at TATA-containing promoter protein, partial [Perkinsus olseni]